MIRDMEAGKGTDEKVLVVCKFHEVFPEKKIARIATR